MAIKVEAQRKPEHYQSGTSLRERAAQLLKRNFPLSDRIDWNSYGFRVLAASGIEDLLCQFIVENPDMKIDLKVYSEGWYDVEWDRQIVLGGWSGGYNVDPVSGREKGRGMQYCSETFKRITILVITPETASFLHECQLTFSPQKTVRSRRSRVGFLGLLGGTEEFEEKAPREVVFGTFINGKLIGEAGTALQLWTEAVSNPKQEETNSEKVFMESVYSVETERQKDLERR